MSQTILGLVNIDSRICEYIITDFVETGAPILTVHDSFIVPFGEEERLNKLMKGAFTEITHKVRVKFKFNENLTKQQLYSHGAQDRNWFLDMIDSIGKGNPTNGYQRRLERHQEYFGKWAET